MKKIYDCGETILRVDEEYKTEPVLCHSLWKLRSEIKSSEKRLICFRSLVYNHKQNFT